MEPRWERGEAWLLSRSTLVKSALQFIGIDRVGKTRERGGADQSRLAPSLHLVLSCCHGLITSLLFSSSATLSFNSCLPPSPSPRLLLLIIFHPSLAICPSTDPSTPASPLSISSSPLTLAVRHVRQPLPLHARELLDPRRRRLLQARQRVMYVPLPPLPSLPRHR